jgi:vancomycin permeability regulator SanA
MPEPGAVPGGPRRWLRRLLVAGLAVAALVGAANAAVLGSARGEIVATAGEAPSRPAVIVLGSFVFPDGTPGQELRHRLETGLALLQAGRVKQIVVSGKVAGGYDEPHAMAAWLAARGARPGDVVVDTHGYRTAASVADTAALGLRSVLISTQAYHLPRALYLARHAGIDAVGVVAPDAQLASLQRLRELMRESLARAEIVLEVAVRGVRG